MTLSAAEDYAVGSGGGDGWLTGCTASALRAIRSRSHYFSIVRGSTGSRLVSISLAVKLVTLLGAPQ